MGKNAAERIVRSTFGVEPEEAEFNYEETESFEEEEESPSYPGVWTVYKKDIVDAIVKRETPEAFKVTDAKNLTKSFEWLTEEECITCGVKIKPHVDQYGASSGLVQAPIGFNAEELEVYLKEHGVSPEAFGTNNTKSLTEFAGELQRGEASLMLAPNGKLTRVV